MFAIVADLSQHCFQCEYICPKRFKLHAVAGLIKDWQPQSKQTASLKQPQVNQAAPLSRHSQPKPSTHQHAEALVSALLHDSSDRGSHDSDEPTSHSAPPARPSQDRIQHRKQPLGIAHPAQPSAGPAKAVHVPSTEARAAKQSPSRMASGHAQTAEPARTKTLPADHPLSSHQLAASSPSQAERPSPPSGAQKKPRSPTGPVQSADHSAKPLGPPSGPPRAAGQTPANARAAGHLPKQAQTVGKPASNTKAAGLVLGSSMAAADSPSNPIAAGNSPSNAKTADRSSLQDLAAGHSAATAAALGQSSGRSRAGTDFSGAAKAARAPLDTAKATGSLSGLAKAAEQSPGNAQAAKQPSDAATAPGRLLGLDKPSVSHQQIAQPSPNQAAAKSSWTDESPARRAGQAAHPPLSSAMSPVISHSPPSAHDESGGKAPGPIPGQLGRRPQQQPSAELAPGP